MVLKIHFKIFLNVIIGAEFNLNLSLFFSFSCFTPQLRFAQRVSSEFKFFDTFSERFEIVKGEQTVFLRRRGKMSFCNYLQIARTRFERVMRLREAQSSSCSRLIIRPSFPKSLESSLVALQSTVPPKKQEKRFLKKVT